MLTVKNNTAKELNVHWDNDSMVLSIDEGAPITTPPPRITKSNFPPRLIDKTLPSGKTLEVFGVTTGGTVTGWAYRISAMP